MRRLVLLVVAAGLVLTSLPALADTRAGSATAADRRVERDALRVLQRAVQAGRSVDYRGTQYVVSGQDDTDTALLDVAHRPGHASVLSESPRAARDSAPAAATAALDARLVGLLAESYDLAVAGPGRCTGRTTTVVEARHDGGQVAGRFWVDEDTGLLLRREVYDTEGRPLRSSAFVELEVRGAADLPAEAPLSPDVVADAAEDLRAQGWRVPDRLPGGYRLFDAQVSAPGGDEHVLHLAYSDGLSTTSLFAQRGRLGTAPPDGFAADTVGGRPVWVRDDAPVRVVWSGAGTVWTLVSDAPSDAVRDAVAALPRDRAPEDGVLARLARGVRRLAAALDPFA